MSSVESSVDWLADNLHKQMGKLKEISYSGSPIPAYLNIPPGPNDEEWISQALERDTDNFRVPVVYAQLATGGVTRVLAVELLRRRVVAVGYETVDSTLGDPRGWSSISTQQGGEGFNVVGLEFQEVTADQSPRDALFRRQDNQDGSKPSGVDAITFAATDHYSLVDAAEGRDIILPDIGMDDNTHVAYLEARSGHYHLTQISRTRAVGRTCALAISHPLLSVRSE